MFLDGLKKAAQLSILKTLRFNFHYFGGGGVKLPVIVSRNVRFRELYGSVRCVNRFGTVFLGFGDPGIANRRKEKMIFQNSGELIFKGKGFLAPACKIVNSGSITFGDGFDMKARSTVISEHDIQFGDHVLISWDCLFMDTDMHVIRDETGKRLNGSRSICIGNNVWIGCRTTVLKGATIADGDVIGAGSVIRRELSHKDCVYINETPVQRNVHWEK